MNCGINGFYSKLNSKADLIETERASEDGERERVVEDQETEIEFRIKAIDPTISF